MHKTTIMSWCTHYYYYYYCSYSEIGKVSSVLLIKTVPRTMEIFPWMVTRPAFPAFCSSALPTVSNVPTKHDNSLQHKAEELQNTLHQHKISSVNSREDFRALNTDTWFQCLKAWGDAGQVLEALSLQCICNRCGPSTKMQKQELASNAESPK